MVKRQPVLNCYVAKRLEKLYFLQQMQIKVVKISGAILDGSLPVFSLGEIFCEKTTKNAALFCCFFSARARILLLDFYAYNMLKYNTVKVFVTDGARK